MQCHCTKPLMCACPQKYLVKLGDFDSSTTVPGHGLKIEPHQMIRYASVLPLGTMGYRAPEVNIHYYDSVIKQYVTVSAKTLHVRIFYMVLNK